MRLCVIIESFLLFVMIVNQNKIILEKKISNACFFLVPVRFHRNLSTLLKTLISFHKYENI